MLFIPPDRNNDEELERSRILLASNYFLRLKILFAQYFALGVLGAR